MEEVRQQKEVVFLGGFPTYINYSRTIGTRLPAIRIVM